MENGLTHIYCGDGKGKTTCAAGAAVRCAGAGGRVLWFQFMKRDTSSERDALSQIKGIELLLGYDNMKFLSKMTETERADASSFFKDKLKEISNIINKKEYDLLILDEVLYAIGADIISDDEVLDFLAKKPIGLEVILTGRDPSKKMCEAADYISEIKKIKHPYDKGISARKMIEY